MKIKITTYLEKSLYLSPELVSIMILIRLNNTSNFKIELRKDKYNGLYLFRVKKEMQMHSLLASITLVHKISSYINFPQIISFYKQIFKESQKHKELKNALTDLENSLNIKFKKEEVSKLS